MSAITEVIRFDVIHGRCAHCDGPVYFSRTIDWEGNRVNALHCWNGHYEKIEIDHILADREAALTREQIEEILPLIGLIRIPEDDRPGG